MKKDTMIGGLAGLIIGFVILILGVDYMGKASNVALQFDPVEAFSALYFSAIWGGGVIGGIIMTALLIAFGIFCYWIGSVGYRKVFLNKG